MGTNTPYLLTASSVNFSSWGATWRAFSYGSSFQFSGLVAECLIYSGTLQTAERNTVESYLARKWGIALPPTASNADAQSWIDRVYLNGGTVSTSTAAAVNAFCNSIDAAGIRDRFYRLNLFCGTGLSAALVPIYRGPSLGGTQLGNTTDTNNNFVSGDYAETGASGGLKGNGSTKFLATGLPMTFLGTNKIHLCSFYQPQNDFFRVHIAARYNVPDAVALEVNYNGTDSHRPRNTIFGTGGQPGNHLSPITGRASVLLQFTGTQPMEVFGRNVDLANTITAASYSATNTTPFYIFAGDQPSVGITGHAAARIEAYSIGAAFTSAAQRNAFHNAMSDFRTALSRT